MTHLPSPDALSEIDTFRQTISTIAGKPEYASNAGPFEPLDVAPIPGGLLSSMLTGAQAMHDPTGQQGTHYELHGQHWYMMWNDEKILGFWFTVRKPKNERHVPMKVWLSQPSLGEFDIYIYDSITQRIDLDEPHAIWEHFPLLELFQAYNRCIGRSIEFCEHGENEPAKKQLEKWKWAHNQRAVNLVEETP